MLITPSNNFVFENISISDPYNSDSYIQDLNADETQSLINLNAQPWNKIDVIAEGIYQDDIDAFDAVYDGTNYHVIYAVDEIGASVYYTNYSGSIWSTPIIIFDGKNVGTGRQNYSSIDSIALEYSQTGSTFYFAINAFYNLNDKHVLYLETSKLSNVTTNDFNGWILGSAFLRPVNIRLAQHGDAVILGYQRFVSQVGARPYVMRKNTTSDPNWDSVKMVTNVNTNSGDHYFDDIAYSTSNAKFLVFLRNSSSPQYERGKIFESSDGLSWIENTSFGNLPSNPEGFSSVSLEEYNNELYATYSINQDRISNKQFRDLVITKTEGGQFLPYLDYIEARGAVLPASSNDKSKTMFVNGNLVVIATVRPDFVSTCNCESNYVKMYIGTGVDIPAPSLPTLTSPPDQTILNNQTLFLSWTVSTGEFGYYEIFRDEVKIQLNPYNSQVNWGGWTNGKIINYTDFTRLPSGTYNFTINMYDTEGNFYTDTVWATSSVASLALSTTNAKNGTMFVGESTTSAKPSSYWYIYGGLPGSYDIYRNNTIVQQGTFDYNQIKNNLWVQLNDGPLLSAGIYNYTISTTDSSNAVFTDTIWITVKPHVALSVSSPLDMTYDSGENFNISWTVKGESTLLNWQTFEIWTNGTWSHTPSFGNWLDGENITTTDTIQLPGIYNYTMKLNNFTHAVVDTVLITITGSTYISVTTPPDISVLSIEYFDLSWEVLNGPSGPSGSYIIYKDNIILTQSVWFIGTIINIQDGLLDLGTHNYTIYLIDDALGITAFDTVIITVSEVVLPTLTAPTDQTISSDQTYNLSWTVSSSFNGSYIIYQDGIQLVNGTWEDGAIITLSGGPLPTGLYNFTIEITDLIGNNGQYTVIVTVVDPTVTSTTDPVTTSTSQTTITSSTIQATNSTSQTNSSSNPSDDGFLPGFTFIVFSVPLLITILLRRKTN